MTHMIQIDDEIREANADEAAVIDARQAEAAKIETDKQAKATARATVLAKLGLTADEAAALLG